MARDQVIQLITRDFVIVEFIVVDLHQKKNGSLILL